MSLLKADTIKPVTSGGDLSLQGDSGGSAVDCLNITSAGDINFSGNTDAKIKLPSAGGIYESDGTTPILTESGGTVSLQNVTIPASAGTVVQVVSGTFTGTDDDTSDVTFSAIVGVTKDIVISAGNYVLVLYDLAIGSNHDAARVFLRLKRASTSIKDGAAASARTVCTAAVNVQRRGAMAQAAGSYLDTGPATGSNTYTFHWTEADNASSGYTAFFNRGSTATDSHDYPRSASTLTLIEIEA